MIIFRICNFFYQQNCCFLKNKTAHLFICSKIVAYWWGFTYNDVVPECYIITMDGLESEPFADVAPYIFEDLGRAYAVVMDWLSLVMILLFVVSVIIAGRKSKDYKCRHCGKRFDRISNVVEEFLD